MKSKQIPALIITLFLIPLSLLSQDISNISSGGKLKPLQAIMDIRHYTLNLDVDIAGKSIDGYTEITLNLSQPTDTLLFDFIHLLAVKKIAVDGKPQLFAQKDEEIYITGKTAYSPTKHIVRIEYGGHPPVAVRPPWQGGFTWTTDKAGNPWVSINCQIQGAKIYFPCKDHPSDEADEGADLYITVPQALSVAGPGLLQGISKTKGGKVTWHWKTAYTISNYCIVFNIGKYKAFRRDYTTCEGNHVPIELYVLEQDTAEAAHLLSIKERDSHILEKYFGEYPWIKEKIGVAEVPNSGMEHQTMITFQGGLTFAKFPNDQDYSPVYFHEYAHEWWANKITNKDWAHMWIQEGIGTYAEALAMKELGGEEAYDSTIAYFGTRTAMYGNKKPMVQGDAVNMNDEYTSDIYFKGALLMHTLRYILGDSTFFPALKKFSTNVTYPYNRFFTSDDVQNFFTAESHRNLKPVFDFYLKTNKLIDVQVFKTAPDSYSMFVTNPPDTTLPIEIATNSGLVHTTMAATDKRNAFQIKSITLPVIDPRRWYFKTVTYY